MRDEDFAAAFGHYSERIRCQNPWFLPWEQANEMWDLSEDVAAVE